MMKVEEVPKILVMIMLTTPKVNLTSKISYQTEMILDKPLLVNS